jgi:hypothetical protein
MEYIEFEFEIKNIDIQIQGLEVEIASMQLQKDRLNHEKIKLSNVYSNYMAAHYNGPAMQVEKELVDGIVPVTTNASEEVKPRRLKKND